MFMDVNKGLISLYVSLSLAAATPVFANDRDDDFNNSENFRLEDLFNVKNPDGYSPVLDSVDMGDYEKPWGFDERGYGKALSKIATKNLASYFVNVFPKTCRFGKKVDETRVKWTTLSRKDKNSEYFVGYDYFQLVANSKLNFKFLEKDFTFRNVIICEAVDDNGFESIYIEAKAYVALSYHF